MLAGYFIPRDVLYNTKKEMIFLTVMGLLQGIYGGATILFVFFPGFLNALTGVASAFLAVEGMHGWDGASIKDRATFDDALHVQTVIDSIKESSQSRRWVGIRILEEEPDPNPHLSSVVRRSAYSAF